MAKVKSVQDMLTAGASKGMGDEEERRRQSFLAQLNSTGPAVAKPSPVLAALAPTVAKAPAETAPPAPPAPPSMMAMTPPAFLQEMDKTPKGRRAPEPPPTSPAPPERGPQPAPAVPPPPPPPAEPEVPPVDEGTTGPRKGPKIPEPEPEEPTSPAPPDRSRPTGGGTTNLPPNPVTTPSPPVAPRGGTATPRDDSKTTPRTARPRRGRWNIQSFLRALQQPGGYGAAFAGGDELAELTAYLDQQRQAEAARSQRLQTLLQGRQTQPRVASARPGVR